MFTYSEVYLPEGDVLPTADILILRSIFISFPFGYRKIGIFIYSEGRQWQLPANCLGK
jgi:hypothetical protein